MTSQIFCLAAGIVLGALMGAVLCYAKLRLSGRKVRKDALDKSRAVLKGKIGEQMAPVLPEFRYNPADARFLGSPIDYIIFDGYSEAKEGRGKIRRIVLMDVKTGNARFGRGLWPNAKGSLSGKLRVDCLDGLTVRTAPDYRLAG